MIKFPTPVVKCTVIRIATNQRHVIPTEYTLHGHTLEVVDSAKYLGVTISEDLQWSKHIDNTVSKANRTMGFIRRNLRDCTKPVKAAAYTTMTRPTLEYASTVWDPHSSAETHKLEQVQRRAARFVHNNYYTERTWYRTSAGNHFNKDDIKTVSSSCSRSYMSLLMSRQT